MFSHSEKPIDVIPLYYQERGQKALTLGYFNQAVLDFEKAIEINPTNPVSYLQKGIAHFELGQYDRSLEDFQQFSAQSPLQESNPISLLAVSEAFARGLSNGIYESGESLLLFMVDFIKHPIQSSKQAIESFSMLANMVGSEDWEVLGQALSPEIHQLVTQWEVLPLDIRAELAGHAIGKHGSDIIAPGALIKVASKCPKTAQEVIAVCKRFQIAKETLVLETAAGIGNTAKIAEVVGTSHKTAFFAEELGFTAREIGQLKQAGKLEGAIDNAFENLINKTPNEAYIAAKNGGKHAKLIELYEARSTKEIQKGIKSLEKQITTHKDKISNPSKYCPEWDTMDPRRKDALINKRWPAEIQCFTEEKDILQTILIQMMQN